MKKKLQQKNSAIWEIYSQIKIKAQIIFKNQIAKPQVIIGKIWGVVQRLLIGNWKKT